MDIETVLAMTGDKPVKGKGVFELDSIRCFTDDQRDEFRRIFGGDPKSKITLEIA